MTVTDFASFDKPTSSDLAHWKSLVVEGMDIASEPFRATTGRIALEDFYARVIVYPDATHQYRQAGHARRDPGAGAPMRSRLPPAERSAPSEALPVSIGRIELARGNVRLLRSVREAELLGQPHRRGGQRLGDVGQTGR